MISNQMTWIERVEENCVEIFSPPLVRHWALFCQNYEDMINFRNETLHLVWKRTYFIFSTFHFSPAQLGWGQFWKGFDPKPNCQSCALKYGVQYKICFLFLTFVTWFLLKYFSGWTFGLDVILFVCPSLLL